ncbi:DUF6464 family protein [Coleofasciculus sp.]|uniref:DUF6464 family protein n=1 Tax=Coleofasciculus sp. TaxID=3100458 RepID=UPI003A2289AC
MFETIIVFVLGLTPPLLSIWVMHRAKEQAEIRLRNSIQASTTARVMPRNPLPPDQYYLEGVGYLIGDITCRFNARSAYIRCAVNPSGPCDNCCDYQPRES